MADLKADFGVPDELIAYVNKGVLAVVSENEPEKTVIFDVPMLQSMDHLKRSTQYSLIWIHPEYNAEFCHFYDETPGDLPNFMVEKEIDDVGNEAIDIESFDDLTAWLDNLED